MFKFNKKANNTKESSEAVTELCEVEDIDMPYDPEMDTIDYLRGLDKKEYEKIIRKTEIYREADEAVAKLDGKKVAKKAQELLEDEFVEH